MESQVQVSPFWPSRRLWLKFALSGIVAPANILLLIVSFIWAAFHGGIYTVVFWLAVVGGPIVMGVLLSPSWRGAAAGFLMAVGMNLSWWLFNTGTIPLPEWVSENLQFAPIAFIAITIMEIVTRDVQGWQGAIGLGLGGMAGFILSAAYMRFTINSFEGNDLIEIFLPWSANFAFVWLSVFFFTELFTRRVGWGGVLVWAGLIVMIFGVSMLLIR